MDRGTSVEQVAALVARLRDSAKYMGYSAIEAADALTALAAERGHLAAATRGMLQEIETLRKRAEAAEQALVSLADVINQEIRENGPLNAEQAKIGDDLRPFVWRLVDNVRYTERRVLEACRQDAERYRWLRLYAFNFGDELFNYGEESQFNVEGESPEAAAVKLDTAIDAVMKGTS
jgi:hypothetical protein